MKKQTRPTLVVTQDLIDRAVPRNSEHCVIADALKEAVPEARTIMVDRQTIRYTDKAKGERYVYLTPPIARNILLDFDEGIKPPPVQFRLTAPVQVLASRAAAKRSKAEREASSASATKAKAKRKIVSNANGSERTILGGDPHMFYNKGRKHEDREFGARAGRGFSRYDGVSRVAQALDEAEAREALAD